MLTDFQNSIAGRVSGKFATNSYINHPSRLTKDLKTSGLKMKIEDQDFDLETKNETSM